jgi:hypothetical protein
VALLGSLGRRRSSGAEQLSCNQMGLNAVLTWRNAGQSRAEPPELSTVVFSISDRRRGRRRGYRVGRVLGADLARPAALGDRVGHFFRSSRDAASRAPRPPSSSTRHARTSSSGSCTLSRRSTTDRRTRSAASSVSHWSRRSACGLTAIALATAPSMSPRLDRVGAIGR